MLNAIYTGPLQDLFRSVEWKNLFTILSDTTGFNLRIYSNEENLILSTTGYYPLCKGLLHTSELSAHCETHCLRIMMSAISRGAPRIFKCYAKIMSFALPVRYEEEQAVILGTGSFAGYKDFKKVVSQLSPSVLDELPVTTPLKFTDARHVKQVCCLVHGSINQLLKNTQETVTLKKKIGVLKDVLGMWNPSAKEQPETLYEYMLANLFVLIDAHYMTILSKNKLFDAYTSLYSLDKNGRTNEVFSLDVHDAVVRELVSGKPAVFSPGPFPGGGSDFFYDMKTFYFFPIAVNDKLAGILGIFGCMLKESDMVLVHSFCKHMALFLQNQRLHHELNQKFDKFAALSEVTKAIAPILNYEVLLQTILDKSAELLKAEQGSLMLLDHETEELLVEAKRGIMDGITLKFRLRKGEGIAGRVAEIGEPLLVENVENDPRTRQKNRRRYKTRSFVSVPLMIEDRMIGVLNLSDKTSGEVFNNEDLELIQSFATHAAIVLERNEFYNQTEELKKLSITDSLTGLANRRYLHDRLKDELSRSERYGHRMSLLMMDLDGFKYYNDTFGHSVGDKVLKNVTRAVLNSVRLSDIVSRYGGDEFLIILPETDKTLAIDIAERLRSDVAKTAVLPEDLPDTGSRTLTVSIGIVCYPEHSTTIEHLLEKVDKALYLAKSRGKNRIEVIS